jgi:hypothetical protein
LEAFPPPPLPIRRKSLAAKFDIQTGFHHLLTD